MKILLVSDTHGSSAFIKAIEHEQPDLIIHAGDSQLPSSNFKDLSMLIVNGNCDYGLGYQDEIFYTINQDMIMLTHGHNYFINADLSQLALAAKNYGCNIAIYGHSHIANVEYVNDILCINPGSYEQSRSQFPNSYMIYNLDTNTIDLKEAQTFKLIKQYQIDKDRHAISC